jgi:hypothetical protein
MVVVERPSLLFCIRSRPAPPRGHHLQILVSPSKAKFYASNNITMLDKASLIPETLGHRLLPTTKFRTIMLPLFFDARLAVYPFISPS